MGYLLTVKELFKYRYPSVVHAVQRTRRVLTRLSLEDNNEITPYWSIFLTYACTTNCPYCVQNYSFRNGRKDIPLRGILPPESWLLLNDLPNRPENIVITGGEPFLYKGLAEVIVGLSNFNDVWIVTNLTLDINTVVDRLRQVTGHRIRFHCSYHESAVDFETFLARALRIKESGLLGSVRIVDTDSTRTMKYIKKFAMRGIKIQSLFRVGMKGDEVLVMSCPEASNLSRKPPVLCRTGLVLFAPNGDVYNCHTKMYWGDAASSFGNINSGFHIPEDYCICYDYGFCHPCQIGYMDVKALDLKSQHITNTYRVLPSNPPPGALK